MQQAGDNMTTRKGCEKGSIVVVLTRENAEMVKKFAEENGESASEAANSLLRDFCYPCVECKKKDECEKFKVIE
jgi:SOS-response transcriptional repressor LexA